MIFTLNVAIVGQASGELYREAWENRCSRYRKNCCSQPPEKSKIDSGGIPIFVSDYPLVNVYITMENHHFSLWQSSIFNSKLLVIPEGNKPWITGVNFAVHNGIT